MRDDLKKYELQSAQWKFSSKDYICEELCEFHQFCREPSWTSKYDMDLHTNWQLHIEFS